MIDLRKSACAAVVLAIVTLSGCSAPPASSQLQFSSAPPASSQLQFSPAPEVCFHAIQPPPCEYPVVSSVGGILRFTPLSFSASPWGASIGHPPDSGGSSVAVQPRIPGEYEALAWDSNNEPVDGVILEMVWYGPEVDAKEVGAYVDILLPGTTGVSRVEFRVDGETLHTWTSGPASPEVTSITAAASEEGILVTWEAKDPDGDELAFSVSTIASDGTVSGGAFGVSGSSTTIPEGSILGPGPHRVRVMAADGINIAWAFSEGAETLNQPPELLFDGDPTMPPVTLQGSAYVIEVEAYDAEDGDISDTIVWTSSIDGLIGSGFELYINGYEVFTETRSGMGHSPEIELSLGVHEFTASVTDSDGATTALVFVVEILEEPERP